MRLSTLAASLTSLSLASARIIGISVPSTVAPNTTFSLTLLTENYIQSVADVAVAWGFQTPSERYPNGIPYTLGSYTGSSYLGPNNSNTLTNVTVDAVAPPATLDLGASYDMVFSAAVTSLYGASGSVVTNAWNVTVHVGGTGADANVSTSKVAWNQSNSC
ncbi:hypothetical protein ACEQ8H_002656 [Pleosporales sp. CAS-2024a]